MTVHAASRIACLMLCGASTVACYNPLVHEDYGVNGKESINGFDLFEEMLSSEAEVSHATYADPARIRKSDLIVYLQQETFVSSDEVDSITKALEGDTGGSEESKVEGEDGTGLKGDVATPAHSVSVLILQRGTTASSVFWSGLLQRFPDVAAYGRIRAYIEFYLKLSRESVASGEAGVPAYFFERERLEEAASSSALWYHPVDRLAFLLEKGSLPERIQAAVRMRDRPTDDDVAVYQRTIIGLPGGAFFAEASLADAHLFLLSDSAPFLNYYMARSENRTLLRFVLHRSLKYAEGGGRPRILIINGWKSTDEQLQDERSVLAFLVHPPWSVPFALLLLLFVFFLRAKFAREAPITEVADEDRDGDLQRHFGALARQIRNARRRERSIGDRIRHRWSEGWRSVGKGMKGTQGTGNTDGKHDTQPKQEKTEGQ